MTQADLPQVGLPEDGKETSPILETPPSPGAEDGRTLCYFNGAAYSPGAEVCSGGRRLHCYSSGNWGVVGSC